MRNRCLPLVLLCIANILGAEPKRDRYGDPLPEGAIARLGSLRLRTEQPIFAAVFTSDGKTLATVGYDARICYWDRDTGKEGRRVKVPAFSGMPRFSADGKTLILGTRDGMIRFIDTTRGAEKWTLSYSQRGTLRALEVSRDGKTLAALHGGTVVVWDTTGGKPRHEFKGLDGQPLPPGGLLALTPDGKQLVLPHANGSLHLVDTASGKEIRAFKAVQAMPGVPPIACAPRPTISPDGRYLALSFPASNRILLLDLTTGKNVREWSASSAGRDNLVFTPDSRILARLGHQEVQLFNVRSGKAIRKLSLPAGSAGPLVFSPDGQTLAICRNGCIIDLWDVATGRSLHAPAGHTSLVHSLVFFPDGKRLASSDQGGRLIVWDLASARDLAHHESTMAANMMTNSLAVDEDGKTLRYLSFDYGNGIHRWDPAAGGEASRQQLPIRKPGLFVLSPDGRTLAAKMFSSVSQVQLNDLPRGEAARTITLANQTRVEGALFSPNSRLLLTGSSDFILRLWDRDTAKLVRELPADVPRPGRAPRHWTFAGDGRSLAYFDTHVRIREIASGGQRLQVLFPHDVRILAYSPDGRFLACERSDGLFLLFGTATGKQLARWQGRQGGLFSLAFSPDSRLLASGGANGSIVLWKLPEGEGLPTTLKAEEAVVLWKTLADDDAARANRALAGLAAAPAQAVPLIKQRFRTDWKKLDAKQLARLIADLDDEAFKVRERATRELSEAGSDAADALHQALASNPSTEVKRRLEDLLNRLSKGGSPEHLRSLRAIEVLERIGTPEAIDVLRELARQSLPAELHEDIEASLRRVEIRRPAASTKLSTPCNTANIRDTIPFPRVLGSMDFSARPMVQEVAMFTRRCLSPFILLLMTVPSLAAPPEELLPTGAVARLGDGLLRPEQRILASAFT
ncbi:MAG TPA: PQQ-binding-like beta-propeller repeat protein, partial [Gemmataceae bacterium]